MTPELEKIRDEYAKEFDDDFLVIVAVKAGFDKAVEIMEERVKGLEDVIEEMIGGDLWDDQIRTNVIQSACKALAKYRGES